MVAGLATPTLVALVAVSLFAGVGITAVGPGGVFVTAALYALTAASPGTVAGTASATFVATGLLGSAAYLRSGELAAGPERVAALLLSVAGLVGALVGVRLNALVSERLFGLLLGAFLALTGVLVWYRTRTDGATANGFDLAGVRGRTVVTAIGFAVGVPSGLLGVGGPVVAVPLLVAAGVPMLVAVAVAQVQSVFVAGFATAGYLVRGTVSFPLAVAIGVPQLVGVVAGWRLAQASDPRRLKRALAVVLVALGPYLALT